MCERSPWNCFDSPVLWGWNRPLVAGAGGGFRKLFRASHRSADRDDAPQRPWGMAAQGARGGRAQIEDPA